MRKLGGADPRLLADAEVLEMVLPDFGTTFGRSYDIKRGPEARISAPIVVMTAVDDPWTTVDDATVWHEHTSAGGAIHTFDGGHFYLEQHARRVVTVITEALRGHAGGRPLP